MAGLPTRIATARMLWAEDGGGNEEEDQEEEEEEPFGARRA